jgi:hypothetical protein
MAKKLSNLHVYPEEKMPAGDDDVKRRQKWKDKAAWKDQHIAAHKQKLKDEEENKPYLSPAQQQNREPRIKRDNKSALAFQKLKEVINDGQRALGAFNPEIKIMPDLPTVPQKDELGKEDAKEQPKEQPKEEIQPEPKEEAKPSFLTKSRQKALALWNTCKMNKRKDQLTRLVICAISIVVIIFALVAMSILSWFSHGNVANNAPQLPHAILF